MTDNEKRIASAGTTHPNPRFVSVPGVHENHVVPVIYSRGGLAVTIAIGEDAGRYAVTHLRSGAALCTFKTWREARNAVGAFIRAGDWMRPAGEVASDRALARAIRDSGGRLIAASAAHPCVDWEVVREVAGG